MARAKSSRSKKKTTKASVDFTGVESGGRSCPDGTYRFKVIEGEKTESQEGNEMFKVKLKGLSGKAKGVTVYDNLSLLPQALWKLKGFVESMGGEAEGEVDLDASDWIDEEVTAVIINEDYEGRPRPKVAEYSANAAAGDDDEEETEEEEEEEEGESEEEESEEEEEETEEDEEEEEETEDEEEEEESDDGEDEEEDEEEEEKPKRGSKKTSSKKPKFRIGSRVKFKDAKGKAVKGSVMSLDGETATIEDAKEQEWEVDVSELEAA